MSSPGGRNPHSRTGGSLARLENRRRLVEKGKGRLTQKTACTKPGTSSPTVTTRGEGKKGERKKGKKDQSVGLYGEAGGRGNSGV